MLVYPHHSGSVVNFPLQNLKFLLTKLIYHFRKI